MEDDQIITLQIFNDALEANFAKGKLQENGIESFIEDENVIGMNPLGGIALKVFAKDQKNAKALLAVDTP